ncbi:MAG: bifunctional nuclease family protein [Candidatus Rokubacteria bacterium]|nr:bifunctional nuclease family protein [Candidatus Rokubacteria bacterium]
MGTLARSLTTALVALSLAGAAGARDRAEVTPPRPTGPQEVEILAVVADQGTQQPVVLLEGKRDKRQVHIAIGVTEAMAIAVPLHGVTPPRPLTHDLVLSVLGRVKVTLSRVVITDLRDDVYYATLHLAGAGGEMVLDSRPSDAMALAIRAKVPVLVEDRVFEKAGAVRAPRRPQI